MNIPITIKMNVMRACYATDGTCNSKNTFIYDVFVTRTHVRYVRSFRSQFLRLLIRYYRENYLSPRIVRKEARREFDNYSHAVIVEIFTGHRSRAKSRLKAFRQFMKYRLPCWNTILEGGKWTSFLSYDVCWRVIDPPGRFQFFSFVRPRAT